MSRLSSMSLIFSPVQTSFRSALACRVGIGGERSHRLVPFLPYGTLSGSDRRSRGVSSSNASSLPYTVGAIRDVAGNWGLLRYTVGWVYRLIREGSSAHERRVCRLPLGLGRGAVDGQGPSSSRRDRALAARRVSRTLSQFWGCLPLGVRSVLLCQYVSSHFTRR